MTKFIQLQSPGGLMTYNVNINHIAEFHYSALDKCVILILSSGTELRINISESELKSLIS